MHHYINYANSPSPMEKQLRAIQDCESWLANSFPRVQAAIQADTTSTLTQIANCLAFAGIQGYPAKVFVLWSLRTAKNIQLGD